MKEPNTEEAPQGHFIAMLAPNTGGVTLSEIDEKVAKLVLTVLATGKSGTLAYKIKISRNGGKGVKVEDEVSVKEPKLETGISFFFADEHGTLTRNDPNQMGLPFRPVPSDQAEPRPMPADKKPKDPKAV